MKLLTFLKKISEDAPQVDMSDEARKARAQAMGFDTSQIWYHGSPQRDLTSMDPSAPKNANTVGDVEGMYFTPEQYVASGYTRPRASWGQAGKGGPKPPRGQIYSVYLRMQNPLDITDAIKGRKKGVPFSDAKRAATQAVDRSKHDSVIFRGDDMNNPEAIVFDSRNVRSIDAPFVTSDSVMMMASLGESDDRLARAKAMGFDTSTVWYHGTAEPDINVFQGYRGVAGHFTTDADWAERFADTTLGNIKDNMDPEEFATDPAAMSLYPVFLRLKNVFDLRKPEHRKILNLSDNVYIEYTTLEDIIPSIQEAGFDGYIDYETPEDDDQSVAVFDPANIRSIYAPFKDSKSSNIMASIGESRPAPRVAYHATFPDNRDNIRMHGLDPKYSDTFEEGAVFFATGGTPDPRMDIWKANLSGLDIEYDPTQEGGDSEHWWYTHQLVVPDRLKLVQKGTG